jgi:hypothetical protein
MARMALQVSREFSTFHALALVNRLAFLLPLTARRTTLS